MNKKTSLCISVVLAFFLLSVLPPVVRVCPAFFSTGQPDSAEQSLSPQTERQGSSYTLIITGNSHFSRKDLLQFASAEMEKFSGRGYRKADIDDAAFQMRSAYLQAGFAFAVVDYTYEQKAGLVEVTFKVAEGVRVFIAGLTFKGNEGIPAQRLRGFFPKMSGPLGSLQKVVFNESEVRDALAGVRDFYRGEGYKDVAVNGPELSFTKNRSGVDITLEIKEGPRYFIAEVVLSGDLVPELSAELEKIRKDFTGKTYYVRRKLLLRTSLAEMYDGVGYADAGFEVAAVSLPEPGRISLTVEISSGEKVRINEVVISGNTGAKESFIRERVKLKSGDLYTEAKRRESFRRLFDSGLFASVTIERAAQDQGRGRDLVVTVKELPSREVYLEPGWGSYEQFRIGAGFSEKNLFGTGKNGRVEGLLSTKGGNLTVSYTDPWLLHTDIAMNVPLYYELREEPSYTSEEQGTSVFFSRKFSESITLATGYQYKMTKLSSLTDGSTLQREGEDYNKGTVGIQAVRDTRDDVFFPATGSRLAGSFDLSHPAFGSELEFGRITLGGRYFMELPKGFIFGLRAGTGLIIPLGDQDFIPISERFFNGGDSTVRSYKHSRLGPKDENSEPLGGLGNNVASIELRKRVYRNFAATFYVDGGNVSPNRSLRGNDYASYTNRSDLLDDTLADFFSEFKYGIGVGLQYLLPVGPIRIDIAYNPDPEVVWAEDEWVFHFSLGMAF